MPALDGGRILLILTGRDAQSAAQIATASGLSPAETLRQLHRLMEHGYVVATTNDADVTVYRLNPEDTRTDDADPHHRILLVEDDVAVRDLVVALLEEEYSVIAVSAPVDGAALLAEVAFDLVITDGFSQTAATVVASTADLLRAAGATPVVLFTAHRVEPDAVRAAGFRDLIDKPFDIEEFEQQIRVLLRP